MEILDPKAERSQVQLERDPSPEGEQDQFSTEDEKRDGCNKAHELALLRSRMGPFGSLIGSDDSSVTIAFFAISFCLLLIGISYGIDQFQPEPRGVSDIVATLSSIVTACIGYIFGKKSSNTND